MHVPRSKTPEYAIWYDILRRCADPENKRYHDYGGRGISVCNRWRNFANFLADVGRRPPDRYLCRQDVNGDYSPENCRWMTHAELARHKRNNRLVLGKTIAEWAEITGIHKGTLTWRLDHGWPPHVAVSKPVETRKEPPACGT